MATYTCLRCGLESHCSHGTWADRHPAAAVTFATLVSVLSLAIIVDHPWLLAVMALGAVVYVVDREHRRRRALAARADWEHQRIMVLPSAIPSLPRGLALPARPPRDSASGHALRPARRRAADHWSWTEPMRARSGRP
ncbi:hypothetical protein ABW16_21695 [Mycolicibacter heraklionensis]|uniref:DUF983 domain-containing protein n=1 Tax=Mycolicibacter heraklionensis TaxID=512402 RepID=A0ABR5FA87_9MYCO|nr:hypothetical protein [Mycolicibacter heraklionensis]KLO25921.1 hypothetical protein ABW16_21695 [Mycolicibacter heraklionensis]